MPTYQFKIGFELYGGPVEEWEETIEVDTPEEAQREAELLIQEHVSGYVSTWAFPVNSEKEESDV